MVDNVHNEVGVLSLKVQARRTDRREVRVPARQRIGRGGVGDDGVAIILEGSLHLVVDVNIKVEVSLCSTDRPVGRQVPVNIPHQHGFADFNGNGVYVDADILRPGRLERILHRNRVGVNRADDRLQRDLRLPRCPARCRSVVGAHEPLGDRRADQLRRERAIIRTRDKALALDGRIVAHGVVRGRVVHLCVIDDTIDRVLIGKVRRERVGKGSLRRVELAGRNNLRPGITFVDRVASRIRLLAVQRVGEHVAAHIGLELALVELDRPRDVGRRARAVGLADHVVAELAGGSRGRAVLAIAGAAPLPRRRVLGGVLVADVLAVVRDNVALQLCFVRDRVVALGKVAQTVEARSLAVDGRLRVELLAIEREAAVHKAEVVAQRVGELDIRGVRFDGELDGPGDLGHAVGTLGEGSRFRPRDVSVLGGDIDRP